MAGLMCVMAGTAVPQVLAGVDRSRGRGAARFVAARMMLARAQAVSGGATVALHFRAEQDIVLFQPYVDGNGNGVRGGEIASGTDAPVGDIVRIPDLFPGAAIALEIDGVPSDPVQVGASGILSFTPLGTSSSGSVYVRGRDGTQYVVRAFGPTGRTRVLRYDPKRRDYVEVL